MAGRIGQRPDEGPAASWLETWQGLERFTGMATSWSPSPLPGNYTSRVWEYSSTIQSSDDLPAVQGSSSFSLKGYPSLIRSQSPKAQPQTWKSGKQTLLSHYRPFYVNKGNGIGSHEAP
uniref:Uncharacterized protein n=1 Tax=Sus scrofa TaxID=9823 RepID=A0A8D1G2R6_PIG